MRSMFGNRYKPDTVILRPFRAWVSWLCHFIGLHPMLRYTALSGLGCCGVAAIVRHHRSQ